MATYYTDTAKNMPARSGVGMQVVPFRFDVSTADTPSFGANGDVLVLAKLPRFSTLVGLQIEIGNLDSGITSRAAIGTASNATRFIEAYNTASAAGRVSSFDSAVTANTHIKQGSLPFRVLNTSAGGETDDDDVRMTFVAATNTLLNASITGFVMYVCNEQEASTETRPA